MLSGPHQKFAEGIVSGLNALEAYQAAYPKAAYDSARTRGPGLFANAAIMEEISRMRKEAEKQSTSAVLTLAEKFDFLASVVRTPVGDLDRDSQLAQEWTEETNAFGGKTKVKMPCKLRALELHAKLAGELSEKNQPDTGITINVIIGA
jgi:hypothetical protein